MYSKNACIENAIIKKTRELKSLLKNYPQKTLNIENDILKTARSIFQFSNVDGYFYDYAVFNRIFLRQIFKSLS